MVARKPSSTSIQGTLPPATFNDLRKRQKFPAMSKKYIETTTVAVLISCPNKHNVI